MRRFIHKRSTVLVAVVTALVLVFGQVPALAFADAADQAGNGGQQGQSAADVQVGGNTVPDASDITVETDGEGGASGTTVEEPETAEYGLLVDTDFEKGTISIDGTEYDHYFVAKVRAGSKISLGATPKDSSYKFDHWEVGAPDVEPTIYTDNPHVLTANETIEAIAVFRSTSHKVTIHWSSIDGKDLVDPIVIKDVPAGSTVADALAKIGGADAVDGLFAKDGYKAMGWFTSKPITEFSDYDALSAYEVKVDAVVEGDMVLYYGMLTEIDGTAEVTIEAPVCGTEVTTPDGDRNKQTNAPKVSTPDGVNYKPDTAKGYLPAWWMTSADDKTPFEGTITGGKAYYAGIWLAADYGYVFASDDISVNGAEVIESWSELDDTFVGAAVKVKAELAEYNCVSGDGAVYELDSSGDLVFVFKRNVNDDVSFSHFTGILVDGVAPDPSNWSAKPGSVVITLKSSYVKSLGAGDHVLTVQFDDGSEAVADFTVEDKAADKGSKGTKSKSSTTPATGDTLPVGIFALIAALAAAALVVARRMRKA